MEINIVSLNKIILNTNALIQPALLHETLLFTYVKKLLLLI